MRLILFLSLGITLSQLSYSQQSSRLISFYNADTSKIGFKDQSGKVVIEPQFSTITTAQFFDDIIQVSEHNDVTYSNYILNREGKKFGFDSVFMLDNMADCESEGFIRFHDRKSDLMGLFDKNGRIAIPAKYNFLSRTTNGMVVALSGAKKKYWGGDGKHKDDGGCNHFSYEGGKSLVLDTSNNILIDDIVLEDNLDFFSVVITTDSISDPRRKSFKGVNGRYYSFISFEKEFRIWIDALATDVTSHEQWLGASYESITWFSPASGWKAEDKEKFVSRHLNTLKQHLGRIKTTTTSYHVYVDQLINLTDDESLSKYYTNCGEADRGRYPVLQLIIDYTKDGKQHQDHFDFLRTEKGYKLITLGLSDISF